LAQRGTRLAVLVLLALLPWPLVAVALYHFNYYPLALIFYHATCFAAFLALGARAAPGRRRLVPYLGGALALGVAGTLLVHQVADEAVVRQVMGRFGFAPWQIPLLVPYFLLVHPLAEEAFWRATIYAGMAQILSGGWAAGLSAVLFGSWHALVLFPLMPSLWWLGTLGVVAFGLGMVALYRATDRHLMPCTVVHAVGGDLPLLLTLGSLFLLR
jgi:membrane protease YdiL (CAAX protease family)